MTRQNSIQSQQQYQVYNNGAMFLLAALNKILADEETKKSTNAQLKAACETALKEIQELVGGAPETDQGTTSISPVLPEAELFREFPRLDADKYFLPFRLVMLSVTINNFNFSQAWPASLKTPVWS